MTEGLRTVAVAFVGLAAGFSWHAIRTSMIPPSSPDRLVAELRLGQFAALLLSMTAGAYIGFAVAHEAQPAVGFDVAFAVGFLVVAASTLVTRSAPGPDRPGARLRGPRRRRRRASSGPARRWNRAALVSDRMRHLRCLHRSPMLPADPETMTHALRIPAVILCSLAIALASSLAPRAATTPPGLSPAPPAAQAKTPPRLIVILVVDQMRADYLDWYRGELHAPASRACCATAPWFTRRRVPVSQHHHVRRPLHHRHRDRSPIATG